ncbi:hypothetical protein [Streptomyces sp. NPDC048659]|uniref:hypothetical protein n=1 Tax=Streptomyces sp. NPDC048659 TaxID=3155489 RepID=UPI00341D9836
MGPLLAMSLLLTACAAEERPKRTAAEQQCDGTVSATAAPALRRVLDTETFTDATIGWLAEATGQLRTDYEDGVRRSARALRCDIKAEKGARRVLSVEFGLYHDQEPPGIASVPFTYPYEMGVAAYASYRQVYLFTQCVSPRLKGSERDPVRIRGNLTVTGGKAPDTPATREANLAVLHSITLATVKELGCANNAGLPERPVFKAVQPAPTWPQARPS